MNTASSQPIRGACGHDCPDTCSWIVEVDGARAVRLSGDPDHPFTRGTLCAKVNHYLERVYHPDRVLYPLKRTGAKGEGRFTRVGWDEALADIAGRWQALIAESGAESILPFSFAGNQGFVQIASIDRRLFGTIGATQLTRALCGEVAAAGLAATQGNGIGIDPEDLVHSRLIVLWGTNTIVTNLHLWPIIREARDRGAVVVVIDPIRTRTAEAADWHLQIRPATDVALALAVMHVIVRDGHVDHEYVSRHAEGFDALVDRARDYPPARAAAITGLSEADIERFATMYATTSPSVLRPLIGLEHHHNGAMMFRAIACLPVLTGAWRHRGGGLARSTHALQLSVLNGEGVLMQDRWAAGVRTLNMRDLGSDLCSRELRPPVRALMVYNCNPAVVLPNQARVLEGLAREDLFTVVHDLFVTETARYADYVLPATSQIEHLDLVPAWGHHYLSLNRPAIPPVGESVANTELFRRLAAALGRTEPWLFDSDEALVRTALDSGHPFLAGITFEALWDRGSIKLSLPDDWRPFASGGFTTSSGKAELFSSQLQAQGFDPLPAHADRLVEGARLQLITGKIHHFLNSSYSHLDRHARRAGELFIALHPDDVSSRGLADGQAVRVFNEIGEVSAVCRSSRMVGRGVAWMPFGAVRGRQGAAGTVNMLTPATATDWGDGGAFSDAVVDVAALDQTSSNGSSPSSP